MSVNAINAADAQQQKKSNAGTAVGAGVGLGAAGALGGYLHKKTPSLEEVFAQEPDTFKTTHETLKGKDETAAGTVKTEYDKMQKSIESEATAAKTAEDAMNNHIKTKITEYDNKAELDQAVVDKRQALNDKKVEIEVDGTGKAKGTKVKKEITYAQAESAVKKAEAKVNGLAADAAEEAKTAAKNELEAAKANLAKFDKEAKELKDAEKAVFDAKKVKFDAAAATEGSTEANLKKAATEAADKLKTAKETAIGKLKDNNTLTEAFGKVKKALAEVSWKRVGLYGGIAAAVGLLAGAMLGGKKEA